MYPNLSDLIKYQNSKIVSRYKRDYPNSKMQAEVAFKELMKFIWLCLKHRADIKKFPKNNELNFSCVIHAEMGDIDNMWHTFILFTRDYQEFCNIYLNGIFFHHDPIQETDNLISEESYKLELNRYLSYIFETLGEDTLKKWFSEYFD